MLDRMFVSHFISFLAGYIAMYATLASRDVDCCLIPESPFYLEGEGSLYEFVEKRLKKNGHMFIVVAEGAGQELFAESVQNMDSRDASGNRLLLDVGLWLSQKLKYYLIGKEPNLLLFIREDRLATLAEDSRSL